jgi:transcriptional regulator with XRE-family HTH domain
MNMSTQVQRGLSLPALRSVRERRGLSQEELAERAGLTRAAVSNLETGATRARSSSAYRLAEALKVYVGTLTGELPLPGDEPQLPNGVLTAYFEAAMRHAVYRHVRAEQERIYAAIPGIEGLWARGFTREEAERDLREALEWWTLTAVFEHRPLPAFDGNSLEIVEESREGTVVVYPESPSTASGPLDHLATDTSPTP